VIFNPERHEPARRAAWNERLARFAIRDIVDEAVEAGPPDDVGDYDAGVYEGVAGERYALRVLGTEVDWEPGPGHGAGFIDGEVGIALAGGDRERFRAAASTCIEDPWNDFCVGAAGAAVAALLLGEDEIARAAVGRLWSEWSFDSTARACLWTQRWDDRSEQFLGFAHGLAGNAHALLRAVRLQTLDHQAELIQRVVEALERFALREGELVNWLPTIGSDGSDVRVQWCHGAPGVICALAGAPAHSRLDGLLLAAGELVWEAGPVRGGAGLCHATPGNGWAFLKLHRRTRDPKWLARARRFAMHAIEQRTAARGLWSGDLGLALYLRACIEVDDRWPLLDFA
jgi:Lanthionine synthetase C-like protein